MVKKSFKIKSEVWLYSGQAVWHFVTVPKKQSLEIKTKFGRNARGWGSLPVKVTMGKTSWETSIFPDRKTSTYLLPLKAGVRKKEGILKGDIINFILTIC